MKPAQPFAAALLAFTLHCTCAQVSAAAEVAKTHRPSPPPHAYHGPGIWIRAPLFRFYLGPRVYTPAYFGPPAPHPYRTPPAGPYHHAW